MCRARAGHNAEPARCLGNPGEVTLASVANRPLLPFFEGTIGAMGNVGMAGHTGELRLRPRRGGELHGAARKWARVEAQAPMPLKVFNLTPKPITRLAGAGRRLAAEVATARRSRGRHWAQVTSC